MIKRVALDADGVLMDFVSAAFYWFNPTAKAEDERAYFAQYEKGQYELSKTLGMSREECWKSLDTPEFWTTVLPYSWAEQFVNAVLRVTNRTRVSVVIVTRMTNDPGTASAKLQGLRRFELPTYLVWNGTKEPFDDENTLLIDDCDQNVFDWGGPSILFPQFWNSSWSDAGEPRAPCYDKVLERLGRYLKERI